MQDGKVALHRVLRAPVGRVYRALTTPEALVKFLPPHGFTARIDHHEAKVGGSFKMSFTNFATGESQSFSGRYIELVPNERIVNADGFDDPNVPGTMTTSITLRSVTVGTELSVEQTGIPPAIPIDGCYLGWQDTLSLLAQLVEAEHTPDSVPAPHGEREQ